MLGDAELGAGVAALEEFPTEVGHHTTMGDYKDGAVLLLQLVGDGLDAAAEVIAAGTLRGVAGEPSEPKQPVPEGDMKAKGAGAEGSELDFPQQRGGLDGTLVSGLGGGEGTWQITAPALRPDVGACADRYGPDGGGIVTLAPLMKLHGSAPAAGQGFLHGKVADEADTFTHGVGLTPWGGTC